MKCFPNLAIVVPLFACAVAQPSPSAPVAQEEDLAFEVGTEAYVYAFPMILMEMTRRVSTNVEAPAGMFAPMNQFAHLPAFPDHNFREVVRPNVDTLYSIFWFDVSEEPIVLSIPEGTERYHMMPMLDMWTDVFACPGSRTTGSAGGNFAIMGPRWSGVLPEGVQGIRSPTSVGWIIGRTQTNGPSDYETVHAIQDSYGLAPLSSFGQPVSPRVVPVDARFNTQTPPLVQAEGMSAEDYFELFARLLIENPPHEVDWPILARLRRVGFTAGETFDFSTLDTGVRDAFERGAKRGQQLIAQQAKKGGVQANGWAIAVDGMGSYGASYLQRANIARIGLGANLVEDAIYPMTFLDDRGEPYDGSRSYGLHFAADALPPVQGFWSLTMYNEEMYLVENPIGRYAIGDRDELRFNADGSLDLLVQHETPAEELRANWLPAPQGRFDMVLRLYWPRREALTTEWVPPVVTTIDKAR